MTIAIVCGGRDYGRVPDKHAPGDLAALQAKAARERSRLHRVLDAAVERLGLDTVIHCAARGADALAGEWAAARGDISVIAVEADWDRHGKAAGGIRNGMMLKMLQRSDDRKVVIAFPGGAGTADMCGRAKAAGIETHKVEI